MRGGLNSAKSTKAGYAIPVPSTLRGGKQINKKEKKMNFIKRKLRDWLYADENVAINVSIDDEYDIKDHENTINFSVINAAGGRIVQVRYYDRKQDRHSNKLHIITPDENLSEALAHILTIETMSR